MIQQAKQYVRFLCDIKNLQDLFPRTNILNVFFFYVADSTHGSTQILRKINLRK